MIYCLISVAIFRKSESFLHQHTESKLNSSQLQESPFHREEFDADFLLSILLPSLDQSPASAGSGRQRKDAASAFAGCS